jgi:hypothetical protein
MIDVDHSLPPARVGSKARLLLGPIVIALAVTGCSPGGEADDAREGSGPARLDGASARESLTSDELEVLAAIERLSAATAPGGGGAREYGAVLAEAFSRWTVGSTEIATKEEWVEGIREWFDDGWRVSDRRARRLELRVRGDYAFSRRIVEETYTGPGNERTSSTAALAETWVRGDFGWLLLRVDVRPMEGP